MKNILPIVTILAVLILSFLIWKKTNPDPSTLKQLPVKEDQIEMIGVIEKINKKIPQKLSVRRKRRKENPIEKSVQIPSPKSKLETLPEEEVAIHLQDTNGDLIITSVSVVDDLIIAHCDIIVGRIDIMDDFLERARTGKPIVMPLPKLWDEATIPYLINSDVKNIAEVKAAIETINKITNFKWIPKNKEESFVHFKKGALHCYSPLGKIGGEQSISLSESCTTGSIMHEMLHTMGLLHEQNREDRDEHIRILWENIDAKNHLQFQKIANGSLDLEKHPFDFKSLMLYTQNAFSKYEGDFTIVRVDGDTYFPGKDSLSTGDLKKLSDLYPKQDN